MFLSNRKHTDSNTNWIETPVTNRHSTHPPCGSKIRNLHPHLRGSGSNLTDPDPNPNTLTPKHIISLRLLDLGKDRRPDRNGAVWSGLAVLQTGQT